MRLRTRVGSYRAPLNLFSGGGALTKMAVFGLRIMPYITSSISIQLLMVVIPKFEQWREEGPSGQRKLTQVTRYMTIALAIMQSTGLAYAFHNGGGGLLGSSVPLNVDLIPDFTVPRVLLVVLTMTAGTVVVMWLAELITQRGVGQGMSVLIFTNVIAGLPTQGDALLKSAGWPKFTFLLLLALTFLVMIVFIEQCQRRIPVTFAKRVVGRRMYGGQSTYIPMKLNTGGVVPIIFAASVLYFPLLISNVFPSTGWGKDVQSWISTHLAQPGNLVYISIYGVLILLFAYFYAGITFDPHQQADVIRKQGGYIPVSALVSPTERPPAEHPLSHNPAWCPVLGARGAVAVYFPGPLEHPELPVRGTTLTHRRRRGVGDHEAKVDSQLIVAQLRRGLPCGEASCGGRQVRFSLALRLMAGTGGQNRRWPAEPGWDRPDRDARTAGIRQGDPGGAGGHLTACPHISTGDAFRAAARNGTELGRLAQSYMDRVENSYPTMSSWKSCSEHLLQGKAEPAGFVRWTASRATLSRRRRWPACSGPKDLTS